LTLDAAKETPQRFQRIQSAYAPEDLVGKFTVMVGTSRRADESSPERRHGVAASHGDEKANPGL